jgi:nucleotidyltransferase substrate binding protein (TIGR01987 family)
MPARLELTELKRALARLEEALALPKNDIVRDSVIQRFEFTVELSWKALQKYLQMEGVLLASISPKNLFREGAKIGLIGEPEMWIQFIDDRNLSSHTYREKLAEQVYASASRLPNYVTDLIQKLESEIP